MDFEVMSPDEVYRGMTYKDLVEEWWNWAYSDDPTSSSDSDPVFLRGNFAESAITKENLSSNTPSAITGFNDIYEANPIKITGDSAVYFPVYNTLFLFKDKYQERQLNTLQECKNKARMEFRSMSKAWATYTYEPNGSKIQRPKVVVAGDLWENYIESSITLVGSKNNILNREDYELNDEPCEGADVGIYLLMKNFKPGRYKIDFGGISVKNFFTRAVYDLKVDRKSTALKKGSGSDVSDISRDMIKYSKQ
jgi:hypothetical protein